MRVLLTGKPRSGKTTLLEEFISPISDKQGFITKEIREDGERTGFELVSSNGVTALLASVSSSSHLRVSRYGVEVENLEMFIDGLPQIKPSSLLYIDEIGQMELFSSKFITLVNTYLKTNNSFIGTISSVYRDEFVDKILSRDDITVIKVTEQNRDDVRAQLRNIKF